MEFMKKDFVKENKKPFNSNKISMTKLKKKLLQQYWETLSSFPDITKASIKFHR